ncbi:MAG: Lrp/AsnC family transcriptional regulator [Promethearchaeota archaeon]
MVKLEELDKEIIMELEKNARVSYRTIAKNLNISVGTVHNHIKKLKKEGILRGFLVDLDIEKFGYSIKFLILIIIDGKHTQEILKKISEYPEVLNVYHITGENSAAILCSFKNMKDVQQFIQMLNEEKHILKTTSSMILNTYKEYKHEFLNDLARYEKKMRAKRMNTINQVEKEVDNNRGNNINKNKDNNNNNNNKRRNERIAQNII